ncbi:nucleoside transporter C-terminal domain-containing protein, partial [Bacillus thuringiensis]|uniref:nucleoside transporter C-terminal domain-containing protein n=1 Tax=Bacillus thuringiensis TaxID=1428 RepID=UPI003BFA68D2
MIATKLLTNQFLPILHLPKLPPDLSPPTLPILSIFLLSFPNFSSIPIIPPPTNTIHPKQPNLLSSFRLKLLYA